MTEGNGQIQGRPRSPPLPALGAGRRMCLLYVGHGLQRGEALRGREEIPARRSPQDKQGTDGWCSGAEHSAGVCSPPSRHTHTHTHIPTPLHCGPVVGKEQQVGKPLSPTLGRAGC